jgi:probable phosphoglycerate mutase
MTTVLAVRHGETPWNREGRIQGWAPVGLTDRGREQARAAGQRLAEFDVDRLVASDLERACATATELQRVGVTADLTLERAWRERDAGRLQGLTDDAVYDHRPDHDREESLVGLEPAPTGGESLDTVRSRVESGLASLRDQVGPDGTAVVVTHGGPLRLLLGFAEGLPPRQAIEAHAPGNGSIHAFAVAGGSVDPIDAIAPCDDLSIASD